MKKYKHVNRKDFGIIKGLLKIKGMKKTTIVQATGKSYNTIMEIDKNKNYKAYKNRNKATKMAKTYNTYANEIKIALTNRETTDQKLDRILALLEDMKYKKGLFINS